MEGQDRARLSAVIGAVWYVQGGRLGVCPLCMFGFVRNAVNMMVAVSSFGEDDDGDLYLTELWNGNLYRLVAGEG